MNRKGYLLFTLAALIFLLQLLTLGIPSLSGDEGIYSLALQEAANFSAGKGLSLNPLIDYTGIVDFWLSSSVYALFTFLFPSVPAAAWMVRIVPFLLFWVSVFVLYREVRRHNETLAPWVVFTFALAPMTLVYSRIAFPHGLLLGFSGLLLTESLRFARTGELRWIRTALYSGIAVETNSTAFIGLAVIFAPVLVPLLKSVKRSPLRAGVAALVFSLLAYPVVRNFPPPINSVPGPSFVIELRNFLNMISGEQPFLFMLTEEVAPPALQVLFVLALLWLVSFELRRLVRSVRDSKSWRSWDGLLLRYSIFHIAGAAFLLFMCYRGRSLTMIGQERYFLSLVPGALLLVASSFTRLGRHQTWVALTFFVFIVTRLSLPLHRTSQSDDPIVQATRWLESECPKESCVAYAEKFWNYWPMRYLTRGSIDLNSGPENWKPVQKHEVAGRKMAGCWYPDSERPYRGPYETKIEFPEKPGRQGQVCYFGINELDAEKSAWPDGDLGTEAE